MTANDGLSKAIVNVARLMRHDGVRLAVSTQSPAALAPELLELVTVAVLHRFHSRDWFSYLAKKLPLPDAARERLMLLKPGHALVFASQHRLLHLLQSPPLPPPPCPGGPAPATAGPARPDYSDRSDDSTCNGAGSRLGVAGTGNLNSHGDHITVFQLHVRPRITADRGATRLNA